MAPAHRSLKAWIEAKEVSRAAYRASKLYWSAPAAAIFSQLQRSGLSIQLNIAEGFALADYGRFGNHLAIAYGSAVETDDILDLALEEHIIPREFGEAALTRCRNSERLLLGLLKRYRPLK
ncbi:MAG TPA: four helix bundle protein [Gemmatimonadales bacterium]|jgi:four helix bundle protein|nr:four helix bundle protein [Gemmatimonadales bacterium]